MGGVSGKRLKAFAFGSLFGLGWVCIAGSVWWDTWYSISDFGPRDWVLLLFIASVHTAIENAQ